ncbi:MAG: alpha/beta hydrolase, partial [Alphaproteobacteria bacterium]|nr:alpha/beta hydrolase [Alphaproteobacteria bacterium]
DKYDNISKITHIHTPLLIMGAGRDATVPVNLAKELYAHAKQPKKLIIYEDGGHSNLYDFKNYQDILSWLKANEKN